MFSYKKDLKDMFDELDSASQYLRNRRMYAEADAVKFARGVLLEEVYDAISKGKIEEIRDISAKTVEK